MKKILFAGLAALFCLSVFLPGESQAVPSFARQLQKPCTACHTMWPELNQYGRQFKVKAYTDVSPEWQMINKDRLNLLYIFPVSARVIFYPWTSTLNGQPGGNSTELSTVDLFVASRVFDYAGVFGNIEATNVTNGPMQFDIPTIKAAAQYPLGEGNTIGLVAFKGLATAPDPFNSLGGIDRSLIFDNESVPWILSKGWTFDYWSGGNLGVVAHGYFIGNRLYAAAGAERGGNTSDTGFGFANNNNSDPIDGYFRLAWDQKLDNGAVTFGGAWYTGSQRTVDSSGAPLFQANVNRGYVDASLEQNLGEDQDHLVQARAMFGYGKETNAFGNGETRKFDGFDAEASYFFQRTIGVVGEYNMINIQGVTAEDISIPGVQGTDENMKKTWIAGITYLPWLNTKAAIQYAHTTTKFQLGEPDQTNKIFRIVLDILF